MRLPPTPLRALRFAIAAAVVALFAAGVFSADVGCGPDQNVSWFCLNPVTGTVTNAPYDANNFVNGVFDPCHCYGSCGPEKSCPIDVDAGPPAPGCDAGAGGDAGG